MSELTDLIRTGQLKVGTKLTHSGRLYRDRDVQASVVQGGIQYESTVYSTPSAAARAITNKPVDGWAFWRLPSGERLDSLRPGTRRLV